MSFVLGIDLGTSSIKAILVDKSGIIHKSKSKNITLINTKVNHSEQDPEEWFLKTKELIKEITSELKNDSKKIEGISFSGQMHGLILLDKNFNILRNAILWNDTRTTKQCEDIYTKMGEEKLLNITKNHALEGFTLPKILWVKDNEKEILAQTRFFLLPKDYLRFRITGEVFTDLSDAAGTLLLDVERRKWSDYICDLFDINKQICPPLVYSHEQCGTVMSSLAKETGLPSDVKVIAGAADNACGAVGSGILEEGKSLCSIGTSGVMLTYEKENNVNYEGRLHFFNHAEENAYYSMGVTLSAGNSLQWLKKILKESKLNKITNDINSTSPGANGLLFSPYLVGERTPYADADIRATFLGLDGSHETKHLVRAIIEGVTFSLKESLDILEENKSIDSIISIGGGAKNKVWLQIQADIFNTEIIKLASDQGPSLGAAMLAAYGCGWFDSLQDASKVFLRYDEKYAPIPENVMKYKKLYILYKKVYMQTRSLNYKLKEFRQ